MFENLETKVHSLLEAGRYEEALGVNERVIKRARRKGDKGAEAEALNLKARVLARRMRRGKEAVEAAQSAASVARAAGQKFVEVRALLWRAEALLATGAGAEALRAADEAVAAARAAGARRAEGMALDLKARILLGLDEGDATSALAFDAATQAFQALAGQRGIFPDPGEISAAYQMSKALLRLRRFEEAVKASDVALGLAAMARLARSSSDVAGDIRAMAAGAQEVKSKALRS